jgi:hypothetical protein
MDFSGTGIVVSTPRHRDVNATGFAVGDFHVMTTASVAPENCHGTSISFRPACLDSEHPLGGSFSSSEWYFPDDDRGDDSFCCLIVLDQRLPDNFVRYELVTVDDSVLKSQAAEYVLAGYPWTQDPSDSLWQATGPIVDFDDRFLVHRLSASSGNGGSAIGPNPGDDPTPRAYGIHVGTDQARTVNVAIRVTAELISWVSSHL